MADLSNPKHPMYWYATNGKVVHEGLTMPGQTTSTGLPVFFAHRNKNKVQENLDALRLTAPRSN
jgi:hypothetical protein